jgi:GNAT superfamily N-acetyltransferase
LIRAAAPSDRLAVVRLLRDAHGAAALPFAFSAPHGALLFDTQLASPDRLCLVLGDDGLRGVLMASAQPHPFADVRYASEVVWWIDPSARGPAAVRMLQAYEAWAKDQGCVFCGMAALASSPRAASLYQRLGYQPTETHFIKHL